LKLPNLGYSKLYIFSANFFLSADLANDENKLDMADFIEAMAIGHQVLNSRKIEDKSDPYDCAYRYKI
jgi:hypothetical protein